MLPQLPLAEFYPFHRSAGTERAGADECVLCAQLQDLRRLADRGSVCRPPTSAPLAVAHGSRGCRMKGARTRWRGVGRDWALWARRGAAAPDASRGSRWGRGVARRWGARGGGGRHT